MPLILLKLSILSSLIIREIELWPIFLLKARKFTGFCQKIQKKPVLTKNFSMVSYHLKNESKLNGKLRPYLCKHLTLTVLKQIIPIRVPNQSWARVSIIDYELPHNMW